MACTEFEFFLNDRSGEDWASRRHPGLRRSPDDVALISFLNIPILTPEIQLLFKAKQTRAKDQSDFDLVIPELSRARVCWLRTALEMYHPGHPWLAALAS